MTLSNSSDSFRRSAMMRKLSDVDFFWLLLPIGIAIAFLLATLWSPKWLVPKSQRSTNKHIITMPPGPRGFPLLGYLPFLGPDLHRMFMELAQIYGPIYKLYIGCKLCVIISSPILAKEVVRDQDVIFANRNPNIASLTFSFGGNDIAFSPYGPRWRLLRKIFVGQMLSSENLYSFYTLRRNELKKSVRALHGKAGEAVEVGELAFITVINMITSMFWGGTIGDEGEKQSLGVEFRAAASRLVSILGKPNVCDFFPVLARFDVQGVERDMKEVTKRLERIFDYVIARKRKLCEIDDGDISHHHGEERKTAKDFLEVLLEFKDKDTGRSISPSEIKAMLMDVVIGGTDTTSTMVEWTMTELMKHPKMIKKCQTELSRVVGEERNVEECDLSKLKYLQAVVKEALRLHPAAPLLLPRSPSKPCIVGGYAIPKGTKVFLNIWAMQRDPIFWDNPTEFRPQRFLEGEGSKLDYFGNNLKYLPFGAGRRICPGLPLGEKMLMHILATFLLLFDWKLPNDDHTNLDSKERLGVVLEKFNPLVAVPVPRLSNSELYMVN